MLCSSLWYTAVFILMLEWDRSLGAFMPVILVLFYSAVIKIASSTFSAHHSTFKQLVIALKQNFWRNWGYFQTVMAHKRSSSQVFSAIHFLFSTSYDIYYSNLIRLRCTQQDIQNSILTFRAASNTAWKIIQNHFPYTDNQHSQLAATCWQTLASFS